MLTYAKQGMDITKQDVADLLELANRYPSPHNGQPVRLKPAGEDSFELYFVKERGLQAADISFIFSFVSMGVFVEHLGLSAQALGHTFSYELNLPEERELRGSGLVPFARCRLGWHQGKPDPALLQALRCRQTSRKKYSAGVQPAAAAAMTALASAEHMQLHQLDKAAARRAIWLNQRAVFDDMSDVATRHELDHWLRYTQAQKQAARDGLAYDCMELNGTLMKYLVHHPGVLRLPVIASVLRQYYLRTMTDASDVFYMLAPFATELQAFAVGQVIMRIWRVIAAAGCYLHPFGTIMSNHAAHRDFLQLAGVQHESRESAYLVFIFHCGQSLPPVPSLRKSVTEHLLME